MSAISRGKGPFALAIAILPETLENRFLGINPEALGCPQETGFLDEIREALGYSARNRVS